MVKMKMLNFAATVMLLLIGTYANAQDLIVKRDGSVIQAKVTKVGTSEVEYKKWSNQDGPQYSIAVADILAINYKNGDKETFENVSSDEKGNSGKSEQTTQPGIVYVKPSDLSSEAKAANDALIAKYNAPVSFEIGEKIKKYIGKKEADRGNACLRVSPNSLLTNDMIEVQCEIGNMYKRDKNTPAEWASGVLGYNAITYNPAILFSIRNKTNQMLYLDLANTFFVTSGQSTCYYIPSSTTDSRSSASGASVNLGAVTNALGVGGFVGSLANGINVGGGATNATVSTVYSQRIVAVAPQSTIKLPAQYLIGEKDMKIAPGFDYARYYTSGLIPMDMGGCLYANIASDSESGKMMFGDKYECDFDKSPLKMSFYVAYSTNEQCTQESVLESHYYLSEIFGNRKNRAMNYETLVDISDKNILYFVVKLSDQFSKIQKALFKNSREH